MRACLLAGLKSERTKRDRQGGRERERVPQERDPRERVRSRVRRVRSEVGKPPVGDGRASTVAGETPTRTPLQAVILITTYKGTGSEGTEMSKNTSYVIHPEHRLTLMKPKDPFYCTACKEIGFGTGYGCSQCVVRVHEECMFPSPAMSLKLKWKKHSLKFYPDMKAEDGKPRFCAVCSQPVKGCGYRSNSGKNCHPSCLTLPKSIVVNSVELHLANKMKLDCKWCKLKKRYIGKVKIPSWSYAGGKSEYHVGCVKDMVTESWRKGEFVPAKKGDSAGRMHIKVDLPCRGKSGNSGGKLLELAVKGTMTAVTGDPTDLLG